MSLLFKTIAISVLLAALVMALTTLSGFLDDPLPRPGTAYRGLPFAFLHGKPLFGSKTIWTIRWIPALLDLGIWTIAWIIVLRCAVRGRRGA